MNYCEVWDCHKEAKEYCGKCRMRLCSRHYEKHDPDANPWFHGWSSRYEDTTFSTRLEVVE